MNDLYKIRVLPFFAWWLICTVAVWPLTVVALGIALLPLGLLMNVLDTTLRKTELVSETHLSLLISLGGVLLLGFVIGKVIGGLQRWLLRKQLFWAADKWRLWTIVGAMLGSVAVAGLMIVSAALEPSTNFGGEFYSPPDPLALFVVMPLFTTVVALAQWVRLRHAVRDAWLWVLGNLVAGMLFSSLMTLNDFGMAGLLNIVFAVAAQSLVTAYVMLFLFEKKLLPMEPDPTSAEGEARVRQPSVWDEAI